MRDVLCNPLCKILLCTISGRSVSFCRETGKSVRLACLWWLYDPNGNTVHKDHINIARRTLRTGFLLWL